MRILVLGCHSASPRENARPTSQVLEIKGHLFLIDCGEGTQTALRYSRVKFSRISHIFISHLHGDHFFGLFGLISTFQLMGRTKPLHIYAPKGAKEVLLLTLKLSGAWTPFLLIFHELEGCESEVVFEDETVIVRTIPLDHRVYTNGYLFEEKKGERKLNINAVNSYGIDRCFYQNIKNGRDVELEDGRVIANEELSFEPIKGSKYAFCSDTCYLESIIPIIKGADVLYHESTFMEKDAELARKTKHSTALQAATIARKAEVGALILGHFSARYPDKRVLQREAETIFEEVYLASDGKEFLVGEGKIQKK